MQSSILIRPIIILISPNDCGYAHRPIYYYKLLPSLDIMVSTIIGLNCMT